MKTSITFASLLLLLSFTGKAQKLIEASYDVTLAYKPATITILTDSSSSVPCEVNSAYSITYIDIKAGKYKLKISGQGQPTTIRDSIIVGPGQRLVLKFKIDGPCLFDHPVGYVPICPKNHKDNIIPIVYGLVATRIDEFVKNKKDMRVKYAGCLVSDCDPQYYCKDHNIEF